MEIIQLVYMVIFLIIILGLGFAIRVIFKGISSGKDIGNSFVYGIAAQDIFISIILTILFVFVESSIASSVVVADTRNYLPPVVKIISHTVLALSSWFMLLTLPSKIYDALEVSSFSINRDKRKFHWKSLEKHGITPAKVIWIWVMILLGGVIGVSLPIVNCYITALAGGEWLQLNLLLHKILPWLSYEDFYASLTRDSWVITNIPVGEKPLVYNYSPFGDMSQGLQLLITSIIITFSLAIYKGGNMLVLNHKENRYLGKVASKGKTTKKSLNDPKTSLDPILEPYKDMLEIFDNSYTGDAKENVLLAVSKNILNISSSAKTTISTKLGALQGALDSIPLNERHEGNPEFDSWKRDFRNFSMGKAKTGYGLGRPLR